MSTPPKQQKIGKYEVLDVLGRGGMGVVFRARDARLGRIVAIKMLTDGFAGSPDMLRRFYEEANRHAALHHNNIVIVFDAGDQDGEPYIVMEFVEGDALDKTLKQGERMLPEIALAIVEQVCLALGYAHRKGVIHRDVKPANVIVQKNGTVKLFDFGIARDEARMDQTVTHTGTLVGTPPYMAPERFRGTPIDGRSDIFSAGVLLYQLLTGRLPFNADYPAVIEQILQYDPPPPSRLMAECPPAIDAIVARSLAKSPHDRYPTAEDMAMDLHEVAESITRAHISELMANAEQHVSESEFHSARTALRKLIQLDPQNVAGKRMLSQVEQRLTAYEREKRISELLRMAQGAAGEREWEQALAFCDEAIGLNPTSAAAIEMRKQVVDGKQVGEKVSQLLQESASARKRGELTKAQAHASTAQKLDPHNSQIMALCKVLEQEAHEKRHRDELRVLFATAKDQLAARDFEHAAASLDKAEAISPDNAEIFRLRDQLASLLIDDRRKAAVRKLEERVAVTTTVDKLRTVSIDLNKALKEFPNDPSLLRLKLMLEPRIQQGEDESFVREACRKVSELPPEQALEHIRQALSRVPGNEQLLSHEAALSERVTRQTRERELAKRLQEATQAIDDRLYFEAVRILERCKADGFSSYEVDGLLEIAKTEGSKRISQEVLERTHRQAKRLIDEEDYENAVQVLRSALRQVDEPVLHRQLQDAMQRQKAAEQRGEAVLGRVAALLSVELFSEAMMHLQEQSGGVKRLPRVEEALALTRKFQASETEFATALGRSYAELGSLAGVEELKRLLNTPVRMDAPPSRIQMQEGLRQRAQDIYSTKAREVVAAAKEAMAREDSQGAENLLNEAAQWVELAGARAQEEVRAVQDEAAAAKKVLRFRRNRR